MGARMHDKYLKEIIPAMREKFGITNPMAVTRLEKIVVNMGVGKALSDAKALESAVADLATITGQQPVIARSKKAISNFKLREDLPIACRVTLRRAQMYEFLDRFISVCLPRIRDFNGLSRKSFDKQGNYSLGLSEQSIFPEIDTGKLKYPQGMDITFVFSNGNKEQTLELLSLLGMPFRKLREEQPA